MTGLAARISRRAMALSPLSFALAFGAYAQTMDHSTHTMPMTGDPAAAALAAANAKMHAAMAVEPTGNPDADFVRGMIPHHEGAVEMAEIVLQYGEDPEVRKLAEEIITAQKGEIAWMQEWLTAHGY